MACRLHQPIRRQSGSDFFFASGDGRTELGSFRESFGIEPRAQVLHGRFTPPTTPPRGKKERKSSCTSSLLGQRKGAREELEKG